MEMTGVVANARRQIGPITFEVVDRPSSIDQIRSAIASKSRAVFVFCNMHTFNLARRSPAVAIALSKATVFNDGVGIEVASWFLFGTRFPDNLNGTDLTPGVLAALDKPTSIYLVGSTQSVAERAGRV